MGDFCWSPEMTKRTGTEVIGLKFGKLTVLDIVGVNGHQHTVAKFACDCGAITTAELAAVRSGNTASCGCLRRERITKHGMHKHPLYPTWVGMVGRCYNPAAPGYQNYGGRGIQVCERWRNSLQNFVDDMGKRPAGASLDRLDNDGDYCKANCKWATNLEQSNNKRTNTVLVYDGRSQTVAQWARERGVDPTTLGYRVRAGWPVEKILGTPVNKYRRNTSS